MENQNYAISSETLDRLGIQHQTDSLGFVAFCPQCRYGEALGSPMLSLFINNSAEAVSCRNCRYEASWDDFVKPYVDAEDSPVPKKWNSPTTPRQSDESFKRDETKIAQAEPKKKMEKKENGKSKRYVASEVFSSGEIIELIYRENYGQTMLAIFDGMKVRYEDHFERPNELLLPYPATSHLISKKVVLFPSEDLDYGTTGELVGKVQRFIHAYLDISPFFEKAATYYVLLTWVYDRFNELPYLRALGDYGSGKSRLLKVIGSVCYKPMFTGGATTTSPIFRIIDMFRGTLILDEADLRFSDTTADFIKILNSGYQKGSPVLRSEGKGVFEVRSYDVFCPKIVASRRHFADQALESRFLIEEMDKKQLREDIPINLPDSFDAEALELRNQLLSWRFKNYKNAHLRAEDIDRSLEPRLNQIASPLLAIIDDPEVRNEIKGFIKEYDKQLTSDRGMSIESDVAESLIELIDRGNQGPTVKEITDTYNLRQDDAKENLSPRKIGSILRKHLKLRVERVSGKGNYAVDEGENRTRLEALARKYGISRDKDVNIVNDVNVVGRDTQAILPFDGPPL
jgi:hypothetical protein